MDDLLQVPERVVMVEGAEPSRFGEEKFAEWVTFCAR